MVKHKKNPGEKLPGGPLARHGGYSVAMKDKLLRQRPEILRYLKRLQRDIIADVCPEGESHMTATRRCLIDRLLSKVATCRLIESYLGEFGLLRRDRLDDQKVLEGEPILTIWLSLNNQIREDLKLLGFDRKALEAEVLTPAELLEAADEETLEPENFALGSPINDDLSKHDEDHGESRGSDQGGDEPGGTS